jgi:hypothetical protein
MCSNGVMFLNKEIKNLIESVSAAATNERHRPARTVTDPIKYFLNTPLFKVRLPTVTQVLGHDPHDSDLVSLNDIAQGDEILKITSQFELRNKGHSHTRIFSITKQEITFN